MKGTLSKQQRKWPQLTQILLWTEITSTTKVVFNAFRNWVSIKVVVSIYPATKTRESDGVMSRYGHNISIQCCFHDDVIWEPRYWPFVRGIHRLPVDSPHKGKWRGALMFSLICAWTNDWTNNQDAGDLRHISPRMYFIVSATTVSNISAIPETC